MCFLSLMSFILAFVAAAPALASQEAAGVVADQGKMPTYRIYPLRNGICKIAGNHAFYGGPNAETYDYALYIWLVLGGDKPILVDAGLSNIEEMNRGAAHKRWWRNDRLDSDVRQKLTAALEAQYEDWEVALIIDPLSR